MAAGAMISTVADCRPNLGPGSGHRNPAVTRGPTPATVPNLGPALRFFAPLSDTRVQAWLPFRYGLGIYNVGGLLGYIGAAPGYTACSTCPLEGHHRRPRQRLQGKRRHAIMVSPQPMVMRIFSDAKIGAGGAGSRTQGRGVM